MKYLFTFLFVVTVLVSGAVEAKALTSVEADGIIASLGLNQEKAALIKALTTTPFGKLVMTQDSTTATFKAGTSMQVDWIAPAHFKNVGAMLRRANGELVLTLNNGNTPVTTEHFQHFTLTLPVDLTTGLYYVTIYPVPFTSGPQSDPWNTSLFKVVGK